MIGCVVSLPLAKGGRYPGSILVDIEDAAWLQSVDRVISPPYGPHTYPYISHYPARGIQTFIHKAILERKIGRGLEEGEYTDHINGNPLDARRKNLRVVSKRRNALNRKAHRAGKLPGSGNYSKRRGGWVTQIHRNGKQQYIGSFKTELEAHLAYMQCLQELEDLEILM